MKTVNELSADELSELKQAYAVQLSDDDLSYGELADAENIPDDIIIDHYSGIMFSDDDFFCNQEG